MTTGSTLYLLMCIVAFGGFAAVLAFSTWRQARMGGDFAHAEAGVARTSPEQPVSAHPQRMQGGDQPVAP